MSRKKIREKQQITFAFVIIMFVTVFWGIYAPVRAETYIWPGDFYFLASAVDESKVIDIDRGWFGVTDDGDNLQLWEKNGGDNQLFEFKQESDGLITIINKGTKKVIDVAGGNTDSGTNVQIYSSNGTMAQKWSIYAAEGYPDNYVVIRNQCGKCLDVSGACSDNGTNIQIYDGNGTAAQVFKLIPYVQTTTEQVSLGDFNTLDEWKEEMRKVEVEHLGYSHLDKCCIANTTGRMLMKAQAVEYKEVPITYDRYGTIVTEYIKLPSVVRYKFHEHEINQLVWFDFTNLTLTQSCTCGKWSQCQWEVPYPDIDAVSKGYDFNGWHNYGMDIIAEQHPF